MPSSEVQVSLFRSATATTPCQTPDTLALVVARIRSCPALKVRVDQLRYFLKVWRKHDYDMAKRRLPAVTWAGTFSRRSTDGWQCSSGLVVLDLDHLGNCQFSVRSALVADKHVVAVFTSPSGDGIKAVVRVPVFEKPDPEAHRRAWAAAAKHCKRLTGVDPDPSGKDPARLCFLSHDPEAHYRPDAVPIEVPVPPSVVAKPAVPKIEVPDDERFRRAAAYVAAIPGVPEGQRNGEAFRVAAVLVRDFALPDDQALALLGEWNTRNLPPLGEGELAAVLVHARRYGRNPEGAKLVAPPALEIHSGLALSKRDVPAVPAVPPPSEKASGADFDGVGSGTSGGTSAKSDVPPASGADSGGAPDEATVPPPSELASGADSSGAESGTSGGTISVPLAVRPCFRVVDEWATERETGDKLRPGVWWFGVHTDRRSGEQTPTKRWVCSPLHIVAVTHDAHGGNFGRLLRFRNTVGRWREWAMPMELLRGSGEELRGELLAMGVHLDPNGNRLLAEYLSSQLPKARVLCALQTGWHGDSFVLPDRVFGPRAGEVIFQSGDRGSDEFTVAGSLEGWQQEIARLAVGNPYLILNLSAAFAGPLLGRCCAEGGGLHFAGDSSLGKSTAIEAACSVWGGPNFKRSWRATANGMEGAAALFTDCLLALDEISECDPRDIGMIVYALGNGRGKQRASRTGAARGVARWRCMVLSTGEKAIATHMAEANQRLRAGQGVRLLDVPITRRKHGAWDELHGFDSGRALSDHLKSAWSRHHGHVGRVFLERLTHDQQDFGALLERFRTLPLFSAGEDGQERRAAGRFALVALAGEVATKYGITGWPEGAAIEAAGEFFRIWVEHRGRGNDERRQVLEAVSSFLNRHGDSRFSPTNEAFSVRDRAGWWEDRDEARVFLFTGDGLREALRGFDFRRALDVLQAEGVLPPPDANGERARSRRINGRKVRVYPIAHDRLEGGHV